MALFSAETARPQVAADRWTAYSLTVWAICILGFAFDIYEGTIMQLVTPILIKEWGIAPATIGYITTMSAWVGLIGVFIFPALADLYGRRPILILTILGYSLFTGFTGFAQGPLQLLIFTSLTRITLRSRGQNALADRAGLPAASEARHQSCVLLPDYAALVWPQLPPALAFGASSAWGNLLAITDDVGKSEIGPEAVRLAALRIGKPALDRYTRPIIVGTKRARVVIAS